MNPLSVSSSGRHGSRGKVFVGEQTSPGAVGRAHGARRGPAASRRTAALAAALVLVIPALLLVSYLWGDAGGADVAHDTPAVGTGDADVNFVVDSVASKARALTLDGRDAMLAKIATLAPRAPGQGGKQADAASDPGREWSGRTLVTVSVPDSNPDARDMVDGALETLTSLGDVPAQEIDVVVIAPVSSVVARLAAPLGLVLEAVLSIETTADVEARVASHWATAEEHDAIVFLSPGTKPTVVDFERIRQCATGASAGVVRAAPQCAVMLDRSQLGGADQLGDPVQFGKVIAGAHDCNDPLLARICPGK